MAKGYFQRLKTHPGVEYATMFTILGALAGATNETAPFWVGGLFGLLAVGGLSWALVLISNFNRT